MRYRFMSALIWVFVISIFIAHEALALRLNDIVGVWLFEEDDEDEIVIDSSGNGHDGIVVGPPEKRENGKFGNAINLSAGNYVKIPHSEDLSLQTYTITAWVSTVDKDRWIGIVSKAHNNQTRNYLMYIHMNTGIPAISIGDQAGNTWHDLGAKTVVNNGAWHHVAATFDDNTDIGRVFVNGVQESQYTVKNEVPLNDADVKFGSSSQGGGNSYIGLMDEIAIFKVALEEADIKDVMQNSLGELLVSVEPGGKLAAAWGRIKASAELK